MFGFGLGKILTLVAVIAVVWYGFKLYNRLEEQRKQRLEEEEDQKPKPGIGQTEQCQQCGTYVVTSSAADCGREGCPY